MSLRDHLARVDQLQAEINALRPIDSEQEARLLQKLRLEWNFHSNSIEGNSLTVGETKAFLMYGLTAKGKPFKDYLDIKGHDEVIDTLTDIIRHNEQLTESTIRALHKILLVEPYQAEAITPEGVRTTRTIHVGQYKTAPNHVITSTERVHYFASPEETPAQMADLMQWYRKTRREEDLHPVILAATFHYRFVAIHPFDDGNGRMARILMNLILMEASYPIVVLRKDQKQEYFLALKQADAGELDAFVRLVAESLIETQELYLRAARGESIDDLADFDKRLTLLRQSVESKAGEDRQAPDTQRFIIRHFAAPLFDAVLKRFSLISPLFAGYKQHIVCMREGSPTVLHDDPVKQMVNLFSEDAANALFSSVQLFYHAKAYREKAERSLLCSVWIYFNQNGISSVLQITGKHKREIFRADYEDLPGEIEAEEIAKGILDDLVGALEKLADTP